MIYRTESDQAEHLRTLPFCPQIQHLSVSVSTEILPVAGKENLVSSAYFDCSFFIIKWELMLSSVEVPAWGWYAFAMQINSGLGPRSSLGLGSLGPTSCVFQLFLCRSGWSPAPLTCWLGCTVLLFGIPLVFLPSILDSLPGLMLEFREG